MWSLKGDNATYRKGTKSKQNQKVPSADCRSEKNDGLSVYKLFIVTNTNPEALCDAENFWDISSSGKLLLSNVLIYFTQVSLWKICTMKTYGISDPLKPGKFISWKFLDILPKQFWRLSISRKRPGNLGHSSLWKFCPQMLWDFWLAMRNIRNGMTECVSVISFGTRELCEVAQGCSR